ncbi:hypothetical protein LINPERHAP1_LOCUS20193 [Linum perenne]
MTSSSEELEMTSSEEELFVQIKDLAEDVLIVFLRSMVGDQSGGDDLVVGGAGDDLVGGGAVCSDKRS